MRHARPELRKRMKQTSLSRNEQPRTHRRKSDSDTTSPRTQNNITNSAKDSGKTQQKTQQHLRELRVSLGRCELVLNYDLLFELLLSCSKFCPASSPLCTSSAWISSSGTCHGFGARGRVRSSSTSSSCRSGELMVASSWYVHLPVERVISVMCVWNVMQVKPCKLGHTAGVATAEG